MTTKVKTYIPKKRRLSINKGDALPKAVDLGGMFNNFGGMVSFFASSFLLSFRSYFRAKKKVNEVRSKFEKTLDLSDIDKEVKDK